LATVLAAMALTADAMVITDPAQGALRMTLTYGADGTATLMKNTTYDLDSLDVVNYEIWSAGANLDPYGWDPGPGFEAGTGISSSFLYTVNVAGGVTFQPGVPMDIGRPIQTPVPDTSDLTFYYEKSGVVGDKFLGEVVPEPASAGLLLTGLLWLLRRRRRRL
jgi:hypothetical protein